MYVYALSSIFSPQFSNFKGFVMIRCDELMLNIIIICFNSYKTWYPCQLDCYYNVIVLHLKHLHFRARLDSLAMGILCCPGTSGFDSGSPEEALYISMFVNFHFSACNLLCSFTFQCHKICNTFISHANTRLISKHVTCCFSFYWCACLKGANFALLSGNVKEQICYVYWPLCVQCGF